MTQIQFSVDAALCTQCDECVRDCPTHIIQSANGSQNNVPFIEPDSQQRCIECQHCLAVCPTGAICVCGFKPENSLPLGSGSFPTYEQMKLFVRGRRSCRQFRNENVPRETIDKLLHELAYAPTGVNDRDLNFAVLDDRDTMQRLRERLVSMIENEKSVEVPEILLGAAAQYRQKGFDMLLRGAPHVVVVSPGTQSHCVPEDAIIALSYFELLAQSEGLATTWCGMLKIVSDMIPGVSSLLEIEPNTYFYSMLFGFPETSYARTVQRDATARVRRIVVP